MNPFHANETDSEDWIQHTRAHLITTEENNVRIRWNAFAALINRETSHVTEQIFETNDNDIQFTCAINDTKMKAYLSYIYQWKGLTSTAQTPITQSNYRKKSRNWLNGRRHKIYGNSLYADMIRSAHAFASNISSRKFTKTDTNEQDMQRLYCNALIHTYLCSMCKQHVTMDKAVKQSYMVAEHAISVNTETKQLLQQYVRSHTYSKQFPSHRREAIDVFQRQSNEGINLLRAMIHNNSGKCVNEEIIDAIVRGTYPIAAIAEHSNDGMVKIKGESFAKILNTITSLGHQHNTLRNRISKLRERIEQLETVNQSLALNNRQVQVIKEETDDIHSHSDYGFHDVDNDFNVITMSPSPDVFCHPYYNGDNLSDCAASGVMNIDYAM
eukprot:360401_1